MIGDSKFTRLYRLGERYTGEAITLVTGGKTRMAEFFRQTRVRHSYASMMIADGTPLVIVSKRMGHQEVSTTANIYAHEIASANEKAALVAEKFSSEVLSGKPDKDTTA